MLHPWSYDAAARARNRVVAALLATIIVMVIVVGGFILGCLSIHM